MDGGFPGIVLKQKVMEKKPKTFSPVTIKSLKDIPIQNNPFEQEELYDVESDTKISPKTLRKINRLK